MPPYFVLLVYISFRENKRKMSASDLERTTHINCLFAPKQCGRENTSQMFSIPPSLPLKPCPLLAPGVLSATLPAFLHLLMVASGWGWRQCPIHANNQAVEPSQAGERAGQLGHQQLCRGLAFLGRCCESTRAAGTGKGLLPVASTS